MSSIYDLVVMNQSRAGFPKNWQTFEIAVSYRSIDSDSSLMSDSTLIFLLRIGASRFLNQFHEC